MGTTARIGIVKENNTIESIYCNFDGYIDHVGKILYNYYNNREIIEELISHGALSSLGRKINHSDEDIKPDNDIKYLSSGTCIFYHRDRKDCLDIDTCKSKNDFYGNQEEFIYLWDKGEWFVGKKKLENILLPISVIRKRKIDKIKKNIQ